MEYIVQTNWDLQNAGLPSVPQKNLAIYPHCQPEKCRIFHKVV